MEFNLEQYKAILNQTMKAFIAFCAKHRITYYASGGTAIGAMRHQGIIPWDDDIDVYMKRSDYERFISFRNELEGSQYAIITPMEGEYYLPFAKFYDRNTTIWELKECEDVFGVYVDIFILDEIQPDSDECKQIGIKYREYFEKWRRAGNVHSLRDLYRAIARGDVTSTKFILGTFYRKLFKRYYRIKTEKLYQQIKSLRGSHLYTYGIDSSSPNLMYPQEWFADSKQLPFEDYEISAHIGIHDYLSSQYGDYMQLPPEEARVSMHVKYYINLNEGLTLEQAKARMKAEGLEQDFIY